jgi:hypothetical protein
MIGALSFLTGGSFTRLGATLLVGIAMGGTLAHQVHRAINDRATVTQQRATLKVIEVAQAETTRLQGVKDAALQKATVRAQVNAAAARSARLERDGLRDELDAARDRLPGLSHQACIARADALDAVFRQCAGALEEMARAASGHANDAMTLDEAWPAK